MCVRYVLLYCVLKAAPCSVDKPLVLRCSELLETRICLI